MGTPEEEVGYIATEELASRLASPPIGSRLPRDESGLSQGTVESPLKQSVVAGSSDTEHDGSKPGGHEKEEVIHIDEPLHHQHHPDGFAPAPDEEHKPHGAHPLEEAEEGPDDVPVLAPDEVEPGAEYMQPAVSPTFDRRGSGYHAHELESPGRKNHRRSPSAPSSRPTSRPVSTHGTVPSMTRFSSRGDEREDVHTTLENVEEYEPLFPEDEEKERKPSPADRFNKSRPQQHRFPSQDIWEDTPDSLQLEATVSTPEIPSRPIDGEGKTPFETPEQEAFRSRHAISPRKDSPSKELQSHLDDEKPPRPDSKQRFPSNDIWEDAPDSQQLVATVQIPEEETKPDSPVTSPVTSTKPAFPAIPARPSKPANQRSPELKATSPTDSRKPPTIPSRPKPQIPARPAKPTSRTSEESLTKTTSAGSTESPSPPLVKAKPAIPSRPGGSKIAALKAGFLSDLDQRLKLGPQGPKPAQEKKSEAEEPAEKAPLSDARKGRAKGPARRKPAVAPAPEPAKLPVIPEIRIVDPWNVWQVDGDGVLVVGDAAAKPEPAEPSSITPKPAVTEAGVGDDATEKTPARDSSSSPSPNAEPTQSSSSHDDPTTSIEGETETEAEPKDVSPVAKEPEPAATASLPDEKVEQTTVDDVEKKIEEASGDS
ncbi:hypothetical protein FQN50_003477 [Emmonsiellopsis sp. PD_5]|nr:hypothetical protein FQN50_003477 [Emmonsiellopsis sp. PD_5]